MRKSFAPALACALLWLAPSLAHAAPVADPCDDPSVEAEAPTLSENEVVSRFQAAMKAQLDLHVPLQMHVEMSGEFTDKNLKATAEYDESVSPDGVPTFSGFTATGDGTAKKYEVIGSIQLEQAEAKAFQAAIAKKREPIAPLPKVGVLSTKEYRFTLLRSDIEDGRPVYVLHFDPIALEKKKHPFLHKLLPFLKNKNDGRAKDKIGFLVAGDIAVDASTFLPVSLKAKYVKDIPVKNLLVKTLKIGSPAVEQTYTSVCSKVTLKSEKATAIAPLNMGATVVETHYTDIVKAGAAGQ